ncbi:hypothetical protein AAK964_15210 [Tissierella praeacuta]|uniref:hypothetical protein n=1 Tax=Tissierella praeacuta TaxID=43131 RepID=UPI003512C701
MMNHICNKIPIGWKKVIECIGYCSIFLFVSLNIYNVFDNMEFGKFFMFIPLILWVLMLKLRRLLRYDLSINISLIVALVNLIVLYFVTNNIHILSLYTNYQYSLFTIMIVIFFICRIISVNYTADIIVEKEDTKKPALFNILYVNTSKVHEIAMLIDNKIMKTVEKEQISEELLKTTYSIGIKSNSVTSDNTIQTEDSSKKRVYENFDVKTTKSIMLRKLYDVVNKEEKNHDNTVKTGQLIMFKDVALERRNLDDTVMILNILQDSKIKNQGDDNIEINMNKMMEKMLDDFTIDYVFEKPLGDSNSKQNYIFQLPYKSNDNFENGYQHNDLQLGNLSLIGIYRGEIDFSKRDSVSSKFLEMMSDSYNNSTDSLNDDIMRVSIGQATQTLVPFEFKHNKLSEKLHLIDVIAIIQELNIDMEG